MATKKRSRSAPVTARSKTSVKKQGRSNAQQRSANLPTKSARLKPAKGKRKSAARKSESAQRTVKPKKLGKSKAKQAAARYRPRVIASSASIEARQSPIHGYGVYAVKPIKKGRRVIEYIGERISHDKADQRYMDKGEDDGHTFLFIVDKRTVIDATNHGNEARFINHSCDPNCETVIEDRRVFVEAIKDIEPGEELGYDYQLTWESTDDPKDLAMYACRCGNKNCRGTMLDPEPLDKKKK